MEHTKENDWVHRATVYQIYPRSFKDSNSDGVGDLRGIIEKLDYLEDLGIGAVWLSPVYASPMCDFGYDVSDYRAIDPLFGSLEDMDRLISQAHGKNIKVIMDLVPNHTSDQHPWFVESRSFKDSLKRDWYIWADPKKGTEPPNNWLSVFGGSGWEWDERSKQFYYHSFLKAQPDLNWHNPEVVAAIKDVVRFWLDRGVDGFRVDAVHWLIKDKQLRDDPVNPNFMSRTQEPYNQILHIYSQGQEEVSGILNELCALLESYNNTFMVTEIHGDIPTMSKYFRSCSNGKHSPFNFNLIGMSWDVGVYKNFVDQFEESLRPQDWPNYVLGNHDQPRVASRLGQLRARVAAVIQFTLRGMPFVYYGDELGMEDGVIPSELVQDPFEKNTPGFRLGRDPQRTPMQWNSQENGGFSDSRPWLPISENVSHINVEIEKSDTRSMFNLYRQLIHLRNSSITLQTGAYKAVDLRNPQVFCYFRSHKEEKLLIVLNFSDQPQLISYENAHVVVVITTHLDRPAGEPAVLNNFSLRPYEGYVFRLALS